MFNLILFAVEEKDEVEDIGDEIELGNKEGDINGGNVKECDGVSVVFESNLSL